MIATKQLILARKYAQAYLNCFREHLSLADLPKLHQAQRFWQRQPALTASLTLGNFTAAELQQLAMQFTERFQLPASCQRLFLVLLPAGRLRLLAAVLGELILLYQQQQQQYLFQVNSVVPLTAGEQQQLQRDLQAQLGQKLQTPVVVQLQTSLAVELVAGATASNELFQWDGSLQGRLRRLAAKLAIVS